MISRKEREALCSCGHRRVAHADRDHVGDCCASTGLTTFCGCKKFREGKFSSEEEIEMAKKQSSAKKANGEKKPRARKPYPFDVERARQLRDLRYKDKENDVALMLRALITANAEEYTADRIFELATKNGAKLESANRLPIGTLVRYGVLKTTTGRSGGEKIIGRKKDEPKKANTVRKPRAKKAPIKPAELGPVDEAGTPVSVGVGD